MEGLPKEERERIEWMLKYLIDECEDDVFSDWEREFIESITTQFGTKLFLTPKQVNALENIYKKH